MLGSFLDQAAVLILGPKRDPDLENYPHYKGPMLERCGSGSVWLVQGLSCS